MPDTATPPRLHTTEEFAAVIRKLYPTLSAATADDRKLTHAVLQVHPELREHVIDPLEGSENLPYNPATTKMVPRPYDWEHPSAPPSPILPEDDETTMLRRASAKTGGSAPTTVGEMRAGVREQHEGVGGVVGGVLASPVTGSMRAARGVSELSRSMPGAVYPSDMPPPSLRRAAGAGADVVGGGMEAATVLLPEALATAPLEVGAGLFGGSVIAYGTQKASEALGAPPEVGNLVSELSALIGGVAVAHGAGAPARARTRAIYEQLGAEDAAARGDVAREHTLQEGAMREDFRQGNEQNDEVQSVENLARWQQQQHTDREMAKLQAAFAVNARYNALAKAHKAGVVPDGSAFEYLDHAQVARALPPMPTPFGELPPVPPGDLALGPPNPAPYTDRFALEWQRPIDPALADNIDSFSRVPPTAAALEPKQLGTGATMIGAPPGGIDPNAIDVTDPSRARPIATSEEPPPPLIQTLGEQLGSTLEYQPQNQPPRPTPETKLKFRERQVYRDAFRETLHDAASQMEEIPYKQGRQVSDTSDAAGPGGETFYVPHVGGAPIYWDIVGRTTKNPPNRSYITAITKAFAETGFEKGKQLPIAADAKDPPNITNRLMQALNLSTEGGVRRAYDTWVPEITKAIDKEARRRADRQLETQQPTGEKVASPAESRLATGGLAPEDVPGAPSSTGAPPAGIENEEIPAWMREGNETPIDTGEAYDSDLEGPKSGSGEPPLPGIEPIRNPEQPPVAELPQQSLDLQAEAKPKAQERLPLFERLKGEEGHLILNVSPSNKRGLKDWYERHRDEYGSEDWWQKGYQEIEEGNHSRAWQVAAIAASRSAAAAGARGAVDREHQQVSMSPEEIAAAKGKVPNGGKVRESQQYQKAKAQALKDLGVKELPDNVTMDDSGILQFGQPEHALKARATDLTLGKTLAADLIGAADPTKIIRVEGNQDTRLRLFRQIADQVARSMPDDVIQPLMELTGIKDPVEFAKHFSRTVSSWGRNLRMLKDWQDDHWADIVHIATEGAADTQDVHALSDIRTPSAFLTWLHTAAEGDLNEIGFEFPKNLKPGTKEADTFAKQWFRQREARKARMAEAAKTVADLAADGSQFDRAMIAGALEPAGSRSRGTLDAVENVSRAFLISKPATMIRNLWTQYGRYGFDIMDDVFAAGYSALRLDGKEAGRYLTRAGERMKAQARPGGTSTDMLRHPQVDSLENTYNYLSDAVADLPPEDMRKTIRLIDEFPRRAATYMGGLSLENGQAAPQTSKIPGISKLIDPRVRNVVTVLNRMQEMSFRASIADATFRAQLIDRGMNPNVELAGDPTTLIGKLGERDVDAMVGASVAAALDGTFAAKPYPGSIPALLLNVFSNIPALSPMLRMGMPFPRFSWVSAPRWLWDHSLVGGLIEPLMYNTFGRFASEGAPLKGRLWRGDEAQKIQSTIIPHVAAEIGKAEYTLATRTQDFVTAKLDAARAAKEFKRLETRAAKEGMLPEIHDEIVDAGSFLQARIKAGENAKQDIADARTKIRELKGQQKTLEEKLLRIKEIGAPNVTEYFSRQTTGIALLGAAYMLRSSDGAKDTKWNEYNLHNPLTGEKHTADLRAFAPLVQYLLPADVMHDVAKETDWKGLGEYFKKEGADAFYNPAKWDVPMQKFYHGKYTGGELSKEIAAAFLSITPAAGSTSAMIDYLTGRGGEGSEGFAQTATSAVLSTVGQFLGRFTVPLQTISDIVGEFHEPARKARIPEQTTGENTHFGSELAGPTLANIPEAREAIPEKISPLTGEAIQTVHPFARALAGLTERDKSRIEVELTRTGLPYGKLVPRVVGDREFDNAVAQSYAAGLKEYGPSLLDNPDYQGMTPELKRDLLGSAFGSLKLWAYQQAGEKLGLDDESLHRKTTSPGIKHKQERWQGYLDSLRDEALKDHPNAVEPPPAAVPVR